MNTKSRWYSFISLLVCFGLISQLFAPVLAAGERQVLAEQPAVTLPLSAAVDQPLTIARYQSSYEVGDEVTISYVVSNNLVPTLQPEIAAGATATDTIEALAAFEPGLDANTLHDVTLVATLTGAATYLGSSLPPSQSGNSYTWNLGDILPSGRFVLTVTVQTVGSSANFTNLETGAAVTAELWDGDVAATARPAVLVPHSLLAAYSEGTVDADLTDKDMLWAAAGIAQEPTAAFALVSGFGYDPYKGSLRGTRGTLWGEAGNSVDKSSLLIAMLRAAGVPARYRHGTLDTAEAQTVLGSMFPAAQGVAGYVPNGVETADPVNDGALIALAQDHWWVEAYLPGQGWTNLDPTFPGAEVGDIFATPGSNDRIAELPASLRHQVTLSLEVEQYNTFPLGGTNLTTFQPLTATYATAQIAARPVSVGHLVSTDIQGGVFSNVIHTYTPYFAVDGEDFLTAGDEFQDLLTNFPLASTFTTAEWITVETEDGDGNTSSFRREVKDLIGLDVRLNGGILNIEMPADNAAFTSFDDAFALWFLPNEVADSVYAGRSRAANFYTVLANAVTSSNLPDPIVTAEERQALSAAKLDYFLARNQQFALGGLAFAELADPATRDIEENLRVKLFYERPRILITSSAVQPDETVAVTMDLRSTEAAGIVYPGQAVDALLTGQWLKGVAESYFEGEVIWQLSGELPLTTSRIFDEMVGQGIEPVLVTPANMHLLGVYLSDPAAYAHATAALLEGKHVLIPQSPVTIDSEPVLGWWEIDPQTGVTTGVLENGLHGTLVEYEMFATLLDFVFLVEDAAEIQQAVAHLWNCIATYVVPALQGSPIGSGDCLDGWQPPGPQPWQRVAAAGGPSWRYLPAHQCPVANCGLEQFVLPYSTQAPIPLPEMAFGYNDRFDGALQAGRVLTVTNNGGSGGPSLTLDSDPASGSVLPGEAYLFEVTAEANFSGLVNVWAYVPDGWQVSFDETLQARVVARPGTPPGTYTVQLVGQPQEYPELVVTAEHTITVPNANDLSLEWQEEPNLTVPMGSPAAADVSNQTNDGQAEIPDSAFRLDVSNLSGQNKTMNLTVTGAPAGWLVLDGRQQTATSFNLGANERGQVGLYVVPPTPPAPGTSFNMTVQLTDGQGGSESVVIPWSMPGQAHNFLQLTPDTLYLSPNSSGSLNLTMSNVSNQAGSFPVVFDTPLAAASISNLQSPISLSPGASNSQNPTITVGGSAAHGRYPLIFSSPAPGSYRQYALGELFVLTENAGAIAEAATCDLGVSGLSASLQALALAADTLEVSCEAGSCSGWDKEQTEAALESTITYASAVSPYLTVVSDLEDIADDLAGHSAAADILGDLDNLAETAGQLGLELCEIEQHQPDPHFNPYLDAILLGDTAVLTLTVHNQGTIATTYAITVSTPTGNQNYNPTIAAGGSAVLPISTTPGQLGSYDLTAQVRPTGPNVLLPMVGTAVARLNVVDKFVQVTAVTADPPFVETGVSSTDLSVEVANVAGVAQNVVAHTEIVDGNGSPQWSGDIPLNLLIGNPRSYELATVDTSGWAAGLYTVTVDLAVPDGEGYGHFAVGQGIAASHSVSPLLVPPGDVTVTTILTTELAAETILPPPSQQTLYPWPQRPPLSGEAETVTDQLPMTEGNPALQPITEYAISNTADSSISNLQSPFTTWAITRTENSSAAVIYSGSWTNVTNLFADFASHGDFHQSYTTGNSASFNFSGTWVAVGFTTGTDSGFAEIFVDGVSQGMVDLYRRGDDVQRVTLSGLTNAAHTISVTNTGLKNPLSSNDRVAVDYFDTWDGTAMPDGMYEQNSGRVWLSDLWANQNDANASGGSYYRSGLTAWYPFTGSSITFQAIANPNAEKIALYLDDEFQYYYNLQSFTVQTRTITFAGLTAGPHVLTVRAFRGQATLDTFTTPATGPATPPAIGSFHRFEEYDPAVRYNGVPYTQTKTTWASELNDTVSDHYAYYSGNPGDTAALTFTGTSVGVGFFAALYGGYAEIFLDGVSQGVYDTYRRDPTTISVYFHNLTNSSHTIQITILGQKNPFSSNDEVYLDYIDVWNGTPLANGTFEELNGRLYRSYRWSLISDAQASGGQYLQDAITGAASVWFPFIGDSVSFRTMTNNQGSRWLKATIDGQPLAELNIYNGTAVSRTYSFNGLGPGLHVLQLERYRGELMVDALTTPGSGPFYQTPVYTGVVRYEEDDPALLYSGSAYAHRPQAWSEDYLWEASSSYGALATTAGNRVSLTFDGRWASVGFFTNQYGGQAEIFVDGVSQGVVGLYSPNSDVTSFTVGDLITGTHTISVSVLGLPDPPSPQNRVYLDYIDVWDGQIMPDDIANATLAETGNRLHYSALFNSGNNANAIDGDYLVNSPGNPEVNAWYSFTGDSFTFYGLSNNFGTPRVDLYVDGQFVETVEQFYPFAIQPIAYHVDGLGDGPHIARVSNNVGIRVDAFASNQPAVNYRPLAEWWESEKSGGASWWGGVHSSLAAGDVNGDGLVELAFTASSLDTSGELFLMRGDGQDAGGGDPVLWSVPFNIFNGFEHVGGTAIAELDGQPGAEIVMANTLGTYAFHSDGSTYWFTTTLKSNRFYATPAIGNLDLDSEPEVVINLDNKLVVFQPNGTVAWSFTDADGVTIPLLADLTGDGLLDILFHDWENTLYLYDYNLGSPQLVWTAVFTNPLHGYGAPAVADLDGDGTPEVVMASETRLFALNSENGSVQWSAVLPAGRVGGVTIADIDGDGAVELVMGVNYNSGTLYAFEANGTQKWAVPALDSSPLNTSAADLDGDGDYELLWNGDAQGFTIYDGQNGAILFNEPLAYSATGTDVPVAADVDLDGFTEVIVPAHGGIRVFGFDGVWGAARPLWNQLNYHVTNINDDLTVPFSEMDSWDIHNSYRAQTDLVHPLPNYQVVVTHTAAVTGVAVLPGTFNVPPTDQDDPMYSWHYGQDWTAPVVTRTFQSELDGLQPGETRQVAAGTTVAYSLAGGFNWLSLPPLYVTAARLAAIEPAAQTKAAGGTAVYNLTLSNLADSPDTYAIEVSGPLAEWTAGPPSVVVPANGEVTVQLVVAIPADAEAQTLPLLVTAHNGSGEDNAAAELTISDGVDVAISPAVQAAAAGVAVEYTLTISNLETIGRNYSVTASGLAEVDLPGSFFVPAGQAVDFAFSASAAGAGPQPFALLVTSPSGAADRASAVVEVSGGAGVNLSLTPLPAISGPGSTAVLTLTVTNSGDLPDSFDLDVDAPAGWGVELLAQGQPVNAVTLPAHVFNSHDLTLLVTPNVAATPGNYEVTVTAEAQSNPDVSGNVEGTVQVLNRGVQITILSGPAAVDPRNAAVWQVQVRNTGQVADTFDLQAAGLFALYGSFAAESVSLSAGQSQVVAFTADGLDKLLPGSYDLVVAAQSQANGNIISQDKVAVNLTAYEAVTVAFEPLSQTLNDTLTATFTLVVTNTGNVSTLYELSSSVLGGSSSVGLEQIQIPAHGVAAILVTAVVPGPGNYMLTGTADSVSSNAADSATAAIIVPSDQPDGLITYLPIVVHR